MQRTAEQKSVVMQPTAVPSPRCGENKLEVLSGENPRKER